MVFLSSSPYISCYYTLRQCHNKIINSREKELQHEIDNNVREYNKIKQKQKLHQSILCCWVLSSNVSCWLYNKLQVNDAFLAFIELK